MSGKASMRRVTRSGRDGAAPGASVTQEGNGRRHEFTLPEREAVYRAIFERRDVRRNFLPTPIPDQVLTRVLTAAHHAGSVGFMQPWDFVVVRDRATKGAVKELFRQANAEAATRYQGERAALYRSLKLEGIEEAPINIGVTRSEEHTSELQSQSN